MRLSPRHLNRATLARQMLLARERIGVVEAVARLGGLQAQEPASPYLALWARVAAFKPGEMTRALRERELVKATLHRSTLHVVAADDHRSSVTALLAVTRSRWMNETRGLPVNRALPELAAAALEYAAVPRTNVELRDHAGTLGEPVPADELWRRIRRYAPFIHVPGNEPWAFGRRPVQVAARSWLDGVPVDEESGLEHLVRSHLRAFGPSRLADIAQWTGLSVARLRVGLERIGDVVRHEDERGREMFDLPDAPLPDPETPAPPRLLPMWDETMLAYDDRSRVLPEPYRKLVIARAGDVLPTFTVDGFAAGLWWAEDGGEGGPHIVLEPFEAIPATAREALEAEASGLAGLIGPREPTVYARYRGTRGRRPSPEGAPATWTGR